jgi:hypothetical protein
MPIYGYSKGTLNEFGLHSLSEVTFDVRTNDLRRIATFLNATADAMESRAIRSQHRHLAEFDRDWNATHPDFDVIVIHPNPDPPYRVAIKEG